MDVTGSIVSRVPNQNTQYYYCLLLADGSLSMMEFISCCNEAAWLPSLLLTFNSAVRRVNRMHHRMRRTAAVIVTVTVMTVDTLLTLTPLSLYWTTNCGCSLVTATPLCHMTVTEMNGERRISEL